MNGKKYDAMIIGFGKGGKTLAAFLAEKGEKVAVIEQSSLMYGGTCVNIGCIPTKSLSYHAELHQAQSPNADEDQTAYEKAVETKDLLVRTLRTKFFDAFQNHPNIDLITGKASFQSSGEVKIETSDAVLSIQARRIIINTGASPIIPNIEGIAQSRRVYTSTSLIDLKTLPRRLVVIGSGYIGLEFASMYSQFGSEVTVLDNRTTFLPQEDRDIAEEVKQIMEKKGIRFVLGANLSSIEDDESLTHVHFQHGDGTAESVPADAVLVATGRKPNTDALNVTAAGIELDERGFIKVDDILQTTAENIWAIGDVNGGPQFTYISLDDNRILQDHLYGSRKRAVSDRRNVSYSVFISPPLSRVGLTETEALQQGYKIKVAKFPAAAIPRARQMNKTEGTMKAVIDAETQKILGASLLCEHSSEIIHIIQMAMNSGLEYTVLRDNIYTHPSMAEAFNDLFASI